VTRVLYDNPILLRYLKTLNDGLLVPRVCLANEVPSHTIEQANQCWLLFTNKRFTKFWCPYSYTGNGSNHGHRRSPFTNTFINELRYVCACKINSIHLNFCVNLILYTGRFMKLKLFEILFYGTFSQ